MSVLLTRELVQNAFHLALPAIMALLERDESWIRRSALHVVVMVEGSTGEEPELLHAEDMGNLPHHEWSLPYDQIAVSKAKLALRVKMDTGVVITLHPELLKQGDAKYRGGVYRHGIAVAASGMQSYWDQMVARWLLDAIEALLLREMESISADDSRNFI